MAQPLPSRPSSGEAGDWPDRIALDTVTDSGGWRGKRDDREPPLERESRARGREGEEEATRYGEAPRHGRGRESGGGEWESAASGLRRPRADRPTAPRARGGGVRELSSRGTGSAGRWQVGAALRRPRGGLRRPWAGASRAPPAAGGSEHSPNVLVSSAGGSGGAGFGGSCGGERAGWS